MSNDLLVQLTECFLLDCGCVGHFFRDRDVSFDWLFLALLGFCLVRKRSRSSISIVYSLISTFFCWITILTTPFVTILIRSLLLLIFLRIFSWFWFIINRSWCRSWCGSLYNSRFLSTRSFNYFGLIFTWLTLIILYWDSISFNIWFMRSSAFIGVISFCLLSLSSIISFAFIRWRLWRSLMFSCWGRRWNGINSTLLITLSSDISLTIKISPSTSTSWGFLFWYLYVLSWSWWLRCWSSSVYYCSCYLIACWNRAEHVLKPFL